MNNKYAEIKNEIEVMLEELFARNATKEEMVNTISEEFTLLEDEATKLVNQFTQNKIGASVEINFEEEIRTASVKTATHYEFDCPFCKKMFSRESYDIGNPPFVVECPHCGMDVTEKDISYVTPKELAMAGVEKKAYKNTNWEQIKEELIEIGLDRNIAHYLSFEYNPAEMDDEYLITQYNVPNELIKKVKDIFDRMAFVASIKTSSKEINWKDLPENAKITLINEDDEEKFIYNGKIIKWNPEEAIEAQRTLQDKVENTISEKKGSKKTASAQNEDELSYLDNLNLDEAEVDNKEYGSFNLCVEKVKASVDKKADWDEEFEVNDYADYDGENVKIISILEGPIFGNQVIIKLDSGLEKQVYKSELKRIASITKQAYKIGDEIKVDLGSEENPDILDFVVTDVSTEKSGYIRAKQKGMEEQEWHKDQEVRINDIIEIVKSASITKQADYEYLEFSDNETAKQAYDILFEDASGKWDDINLGDEHQNRIYFRNHNFKLEAIDRLTQEGMSGLNKQGSIIKQAEDIGNANITSETDLGDQGIDSSMNGQAPQDDSNIHQNKPEQLQPEQSQKSAVEKTPELEIKKRFTGMDADAFSKLENDLIAAKNIGDDHKAGNILDEEMRIIKKYLMSTPASPIETSMATLASYWYKPEELLARRYTGVQVMNKDWWDSLSRASAPIFSLSSKFPVTIENVSFSKLEAKDWDVKSDGYVEWVCALQKLGGSGKKNKRMGIFRVNIWKNGSVEMIPVFFDVLGRTYSLDKNGFLKFFGE
jgi:hypothetical protein